MSMTSLYQIDKVTSRDFFTFSGIYRLDKRHQHSAMMTIQEIRMENARLLARQAGSDAEFADRVGLSPPRVSHLIGINPVKNIGHVTARRIEAAFGLTKGWLDVRHAAEEKQDDTAGHKAAVKNVGGSQDAANDEVRADEILELITAYKGASQTERSLVLSSLKASAKRASRKRKIPVPK